MGQSDEETRVREIFNYMEAYWRAFSDVEDERHERDYKAAA